ncbi:MAG: sulfur carrier protein ThiS [Bacteroidales bacterium]|nr:sulfur carrier protein ThiS [Bacteroidales bacterium]MDD4739095.1 sulfur carrier protein ThiS [Bacteroidales bacterium]
MKIKVNNREKIMPENISITELVKLLNYSDSVGIALALDQEVVPKSDWDKTFLKDGANITIIQATCGG